jgi:CRISPR-associated endoribonuclease Cas6
MPSRWFVPVHGLLPERVRIEHVHAAFSHWFDVTSAEHRALVKPYTVSPPAMDAQGVVGIEIATLTGAADEAVETRSRERVKVRLGNQVRQVSPAQLGQSTTWGQLAQRSGERCWELELVTPTTFRNGNRSSPLPAVGTIMDGLARSWRAWSDVELPEVSGWNSVWVSALDLTSDIIEVLRRMPDGTRRPVKISGSVGSLSLRCDDTDAAAVAGPLLRSAPFVGIGGQTTQGLGVARVRGTTGRRAVPNQSEAVGVVGRVG